MKFQENIDYISRNSQDFQKFLFQVKINSRDSQKLISQSQVKSENYPLSSKQQNEVKVIQNCPNPEEIYQSQYCIKNTFNNSLKQRVISPINKININQTKFAIRNLEKINPGSSQFYQEQKLAKLTSNPIIELNSIKDLPYWLFQNIRKKNLNKLKNVYLKEDLLRKNQMMDKDQEFKQQQFFENRKSFKQRHLNKTYLQRSQVLTVNPEKTRSSIHQNNTLYKRISINELNQIRNVSSSFQAKQSLRQESSFKKSRNHQDVIIKDYDYSYCPQQQKQTKSMIKKQKNTSFHHQGGRKNDQSSQILTSNRYRIRQQERKKSQKSKTKFIGKRLTTVSQQQPLNEPHNNNIEYKKS